MNEESELQVNEIIDESMNDYMNKGPVDKTKNSIYKWMRDT